MLKSSKTKIRCFLYYPFICLSIWAFAVFFVTLFIRYDFIEKTPEMRTQDVQYLFFILRNAKDWIEEIAQGDYSFVPYALPESFEFPGEYARYRAVAYSPFCILLPVLFSSLFQVPPDLMLLQGINLGLHAICILLAGVLVHTTLRPSLGRSLSLIYGLFAALLAGFLPGAMYFFLYTYSADTLVLPFILGVVFCEIKRDQSFRQNTKHSTTFIIALQWTLIILGVLAEWLMVTLVLAVVLKRMVAARLIHAAVPKRYAIEPIFPLFLALAFFALRTIHVRGALEVIERMLIHAGTRSHSNPFSEFLNEFWFYALPKYAALATPWLLVPILSISLISLFAFRIKPLASWFLSKGLQDALVAVTLLSLSTFFHMALLWEHYSENHYASVKFAVFLAVVLPLLLAPVVNAALCVMTFWQSRRHAVKSCSHTTSRKHAFFHIGAVILLIGIWMVPLYPGYASLLAATSRPYEEIAHAFDNSKIEGDVLFSPIVHTIDDSLALSAYLNRWIWPLDARTYVLPSLLEGQPILISPMTEFPDSLEHWLVCLRLMPEPVRTVPRSFTLGVICQAGDTPGEEILAISSHASHVQHLGAYDNYIIKSETLRSAFAGNSLQIH